MEYKDRYHCRMAVFVLSLLSITSRSTLLSFEVSGFCNDRRYGGSHVDRPRYLHRSPSLGIMTTTTSLFETPQSSDSKNGGDIDCLKGKLMDIADRTNRGFFASDQDRKRAKEIIYQLARCNPSRSPARDYYEKDTRTDESDNGGDATISGKWTLIYTDAPDITSLDPATSRIPLPQGVSWTKLGRIGQECKAPYIKNVIEWLRPDWASNDERLSSNTPPRIFQKVVTSASATPSKPLLVDLKLAGFELESDNNTMDDDSDQGKEDNLLQRIQKQGLFFPTLDIKGPVPLPFGQFEILFLDDELRVIRTSQNYLAANIRIMPQLHEEWF